MRLNSIFVFLFCCFSFTSAYATNLENLIGKENTDFNSRLDYWTPERLQHAKPFPLPQIEQNRIRAIPEFKNENHSITDINDKEGQAPTENIKLNFKPLFKTNDEETSINNRYMPMNTGSLNEPFTSSRLVPITADLSYPYRAVGKLFFTIPGQGNFVCSAAVIAKRIVLTAGHCVHSGFGGASGYFTNFLFIPAYRDGAAPLNRWNWTYVLTTPTWITGGGIVPNGADYAMIEMSDLMINLHNTSVGAVTGTFGFALNKLFNNHAHLLGYPCNLDSCRKMHQVTAQSARLIPPNNVEYGSDMGPGSSGGPWVQNFGILAAGQRGGLNPGVNKIIGVTSWGYTNPQFMAEGASNFDGRFTSLYNTICAHRSGNC